MPDCPLRVSKHRVVFALATLLILSAPSFLQAQDGVIDLAALPDYEKNSYALTNTGATLGRLLFYDKRLSRNDTVSCSSCHQQDHAFGHPDVAGTGVGGSSTRHPMRLANAGDTFAPFPGSGAFFGDRRALTLEDAVTQPLRNTIELGFSGTNGDPDFGHLIAKLSVLPEYRTLFPAAFGSAVIDENSIQKALAQFIRSIRSVDSKYDAGGGRNHGIGNLPFSNYSDSENRGKQLFSDRGCGFCHQPENTNSAGNNGVITAIGGGTDVTVSRSPSLRDLFNPSGQLNGPMMHDGSLPTIAKVLDHYSAIPSGIPNITAMFQFGQTFSLSDQDRADLEAFLKTLTSKAIYTDPKWSSPFRLDGTITVTDSAPPPSQTINLSSRMRVLTGNRVAIGGFIITGVAPKRVLIRAQGPSLAPFGLFALLADPTITLNGPAGFIPIVNDNWKSLQEDEIKATGLAPGDDRESAIIATLDPGAYTAVLSGTDGGTGTGILEIYDLDLAADSKLANISTRAYTGTGEDMLIAGFSVGKTSNLDNIVVRGLSPSLVAQLPGELMYDLSLEVRNADGATLVAYDRRPGAAEDEKLRRLGLLPSLIEEPVVLFSVGPGAYTALLSPRTYNAPAIALIEIYSIGRLP